MSRFTEWGRGLPTQLEHFESPSLSRFLWAPAGQSSGCLRPRARCLRYLGTLVCPRVEKSRVWKTVTPDQAAPLQSDPHQPCAPLPRRVHGPIPQVCEIEGRWVARKKQLNINTLVGYLGSSTALLHRRLSSLVPIMPVFPFLDLPIELAERILLSADVPTVLRVIQVRPGISLLITSR